MLRFDANVGPLRTRGSWLHPMLPARQREPTVARQDRSGIGWQRIQWRAPPRTAPNLPTTTMFGSRTDRFATATRPIRRLLPAGEAPRMMTAPAALTTRIHHAPIPSLLPCWHGRHPHSSQRRIRRLVGSEGPLPGLVPIASRRVAPRRRHQIGRLLVLLRPPAPRTTSW